MFKRITLFGFFVFIALTIVWIASMNMVTPLSGEWKKMFKAPAQDLTDYAKKHPLHLRNKKIVDEDISESRFVGARFENVYWDDVVAQEGEFIGARFECGEMHDTSFSLSRIEDASFSNMTMTKVAFGKAKLTNVIFENILMHENTFVGAELINVTFRNCKIYNSEIRNLKTSKILIENSALSDVSFFQSLLELEIQNSTVDEAIEFMGAQAGSSLTIIGSTIGPYSDFGGSNFTRLEIRNSTIKNSRANGITAKEVIIDKLDSDFAIADSTVGTARIRDLTGVFSLGGTKAASVTVEGCQPPVKVYFDEFIADRLTIRGCNSDKLVLDKAVIKELTLANMTIDWIVLDALKTDAFNLTNVLIQDRLSAKGALAESVPVAQWRRQPDTLVEAEGSNIPLP